MNIESLFLGCGLCFQVFVFADARGKVWAQTVRDIRDSHAGVTYRASSRGKWPSLLRAPNDLIQGREKEL
eukprot:SAG11_NODE_177_length_13334_cov_9.614280_6_plen_70_part_00